MRHRGTLLVEVILATLIFSVGLLALGLSLAYGARIIIDSGQNTVKEQKLANLVEQYLMDRTVKRTDATVNPLNQKIIHNNEEIIVVTQMQEASILINNKSLAIDRYRYKLPSKKTAAFYVVERKE